MLTILTDTNAFNFMSFIILILGGGFISIVVWQFTKLSNKIEHLDHTMSVNNTYLKQHYSLLKDHEIELREYRDRIIKLEMNGKTK